MNNHSVRVLFAQSEQAAMETTSEHGERESLYLQDFYVGMRLTSDTYALDAQQIKAFAQQFDPQPFHLDEKAAAGTLFGELVASGWHTAALTMRLLTTMRPSISGGIIGAGAELNWPTPTRPGDVLRAECEVLEIRPSRSRPDRAIVVLRVETRNQRNETLQDLKAKLIVFRR
jgi:acyl dehydratase